MSIFDRLRKTTPTATAASDASAVVDDKKVAAKKSAAKGKKATVATTTVVPMASHARVLIRPLVTEKATLTGTYVFMVARSANKSEIAKAVEAQYGVKPKAVRVMNMYGKQIRWNNKIGKRSDWKKAVVSLPAGKTINVYEALS
jgi:large subunit ribosomal protein L23